MYVIGNLASDQVEGTAPTPAEGESTVSNGKFYVPVPEGVGIEVTPISSLIVPDQVTTLPGEIASQFLARNPMYDHVLWNFFLEATDIAALDLGPGTPSPTSGNVLSGFIPTLSPGPNGPRCQVGRGSVGPTGVAPNSVAVLPRNLNRTPGTYGGLVTELLDTTPFTGPSGTDEVLVWWKLAEVNTQEDVLNGFNATVGINQPALRELVETTQEPAGFLVYASADDGVTWHECRLTEPTDLVTAGTDLRIAFVNNTEIKYHLLGFIVLFVDAP